MAARAAPHRRGAGRARVAPPREAGGLADALADTLAAVLADALAAVLADPLAAVPADALADVLASPGAPGTEPSGPADPSASRAGMLAARPPGLLPSGRTSRGAAPRRWLPIVPGPRPVAPAARPVPPGARALSRRADLRARERRTRSSNRSRMSCTP